MKDRKHELKIPGQPGPDARGFVWYLIFALVLLWGWQAAMLHFAVRTIAYSDFKQRLAQREVAEVTVKPDEVLGRIAPKAADAAAKAEPFYFRTVRVEDPDLVKELQAAGVKYDATRPSFLSQFLVAWVLPIALMIGLWTLFAGRAGHGLLQIGKSRARLIADENTGVTFEDVAGCDEAKFELKEVVVRRRPRAEREIFELHFVEGFEPDEIAMVCHRPVKEIRAAIQTLQRRVRAEFLEAGQPFFQTE